MTPVEAAQLYLHLQATVARVHFGCSPWARQLTVEVLPFRHDAAYASIQATLATGDVVTSEQTKVRFSRNVCLLPYPVSAPEPKLQLQLLTAETLQQTYVVCRTLIDHEFNEQFHVKVATDGHTSGHASDNPSGLHDRPHDPHRKAS